MSGSEKCGSSTPPESPETGELPPQSEKEVRVPYWDTPPPPPPGHDIRPRQIIPPVPEGEENPDDTPSPPVELD